MYLIVDVLCAIVFVKTLGYAVWCFKNTGAAGGVAVAVIAALALAPVFMPA